MGRAIGETMAVLMATGNAVQIPHSLLDPIRTLTATIAAELGEAVKGDVHYRYLFVIGLVLFAVTFVVNLTADLVVKGIRRETRVKPQPGRKSRSPWWRRRAGAVPRRWRCMPRWKRPWPPWGRPCTRPCRSAATAGPPWKSTWCPAARSSDVPRRPARVFYATSRRRSRRRRRHAALALVGRRGGRRRPGTPAPRRSTRPGAGPQRADRLERRVQRLGMGAAEEEQRVAGPRALGSHGHGLVLPVIAILAYLLVKRLAGPVADLSPAKPAELHDGRRHLGARWWARFSWCSCRWPRRPRWAFWPASISTNTPATTGSRGW